ncbi:RNA pseudouridine synthase 5, partial [Linum grandiflorum]
GYLAHFKGRNGVFHRFSSPRFVLSLAGGRRRQKNKNSETFTVLSSRRPSFQMSRKFGIPWPELNGGLFYNDALPPSQSGSTLIDFYSTKYKNSAPVKGWLQRIHNGQITVDGVVVKEPSTILRAGSALVYHRLPWREPSAPYTLEILYEDDEMVALNKPSGLQVLPGGLFQQRTVLTQLQWWANHGSHPVPVHRLGRGTSGILLCAKSKLAKTRLAAYFAEGTSLIGSNSGDHSLELEKGRKISKIYRALADGIVSEDTVVIRQPIGVIRYPGVAKGLYVASTSGKPALSKVRVLERDLQRNCSLVEVQIESGRPHQIRIHLSFIGHPLVEDPLYIAGGKPKCLDSQLIKEDFAADGGYEKPTNAVPGDCGYYLHAHQLTLMHPSTLEVIHITAPLPLILQTQTEQRLNT